jgi:hypothetical protein
MSTRALDAVRNRSDRAGLDTGPVGEFLGRYRNAIRWIIGGGVVLLYVLADHPTGSWTLKVLIVAALLLLIVELLARPPAPATTTDVPDEGPETADATPASGRTDARS